MIEEFKKILRLQSEASFILSNNHPRHNYGRGGVLRKISNFSHSHAFLTKHFYGYFYKKKNNR